jgi:hypothetical protein
VGAVNSIVVSNTGTIDGQNNAIQARNDSAYLSGISTNTIIVSNSSSGYIIAVDNGNSGGNGLDLENHNYSVGTSANSTSVFNAGYIESNQPGGDGIYVYNHDYGSGSGSTDTTRIVNSATGTISSYYSDGIYVRNTSFSGTYSTQVTNYGYIYGNSHGNQGPASWGVYFDSSNSSLTAIGGLIRGGGGSSAIDLAGSNSSITIAGRSNISGLMQGNDNTGNVLNLDLFLTPAASAALKTYAATTVSGYHNFTDPSGDYLTWEGFKTVNVNSISLELLVDPGLVNVAKAIDTNGLPVNYGAGSTGQSFDPFVVAAVANPEAALNELVGREINQGIDTLGVNLATTMASDLDEHLDNLLTGGQIGGFDVGGLHVSDAGSMYAFSDTSSQLDSLLHMTGTSVYGGTEMSTDSKEMVSAPQPSWGVWASGNVTLADESAPAPSPGSTRRWAARPRLRLPRHAEPRFGRAGQLHHRRGQLRRWQPDRQQHRNRRALRHVARRQLARQRHRRGRAQPSTTTSAPPSAGRPAAAPTATTSSPTGPAATTSTWATGGPSRRKWACNTPTSTSTATAKPARACST